MLNRSILLKRFVQFKRKQSRFYTTKRKYPINPEDSEKLPVFDYAPGNSSYNRVFVWGCAATGALGIPFDDTAAKRTEYIRLPRRLKLADTCLVSTIGCGFGFTVFGVDSNNDKKLFGVGINMDSQLGYHAMRKDAPLEVLQLPQPIYLPLINENCQIKKIAGGRAHLLILTDDGLFTLGNNSYGQCGRTVVPNENYSGSKLIHHIPTIDDKVIIDVVCGQDHSIALTDDGSVYSCGWGADGQTGLGHYNCQDSFTKANGDVASETIIKVASRGDFVLAISDKGEVFGWGNTEYGQIPTQDDSQQVCNPTHIKFCSNFGKIRDAAAGGASCMILNENGHVFVWGYGILGMGPAVQHSKTPLQIPPNLFGVNTFQPDVRVESIACGMNHLCAVTNQGDLYTWGRNKTYCLGLGDEKDQYFPLRVALGGLVRQVSCGVDHTVALCKPFM